MKPTCTRNHRINQLLHKRLDWKCKQCFRDQNSVKQKTTGNRYTGKKIIIDNNSNVENSNDDNVNNNNNNNNVENI